jgi:hypothetical protein
MKKVKVIVVVLACCVFLGCAQRAPQLSREEALAQRRAQIAKMTRVYAGHSRDDILAAAGRIFTLADEDYRVQHLESGVNAHRKWMLYLVFSVTFGTDHWYVRAEDTPDGVQVSARVVSNSQAVAMAPGGGGGAQASTLPSIESCVQSDALYYTFFQRLEYLIGECDTWFDCRTAKAYFKGHGISGRMEPFCLLANDDQPAAAIAQEQP